MELRLALSFILNKIQYNTYTKSNFSYALKPEVKLEVMLYAGLLNGHEFCTNFFRSL